MPIIPSNLRAPLNKVNGGRAVSALLTSNPGALTLGIAAAQAGASVVEVGGVRAAAAPYASAAVAVTRLESRGSRIWGALCSGVGPVAPIIPGTPPVPGYAEQRINFHSNPATGQVNPFGVEARLNIWGSIGKKSDYPVSGSWATQQNGTWPYNEWGGIVPPGFQTSVGGATTSWCTGYWTLPPFAGVPGTPATQTPDWSTAPGTLSWASAGLPWWGLVESAARAGSWVRRLAWTDADRAIRFEAGAGTTRAVAVQMASGLAVAERVTTAVFGVAEFLAEDWVVLSANESPIVDVTDFIFSGPAASVLFAVFGVGGGGTPGADPGSGSDGTVPQTGRGFVYVRDGVTTLVPARDISGADWEP
jgi:hypothetical protein